MPWKKISCEEAKTKLETTKSAFGVFQQEMKEYLETGVEGMILELNKENLAHFADSLYDGLPDIELSIKKAKEIMGEDFYGAERYLEVFGQEMYLDDLGRVPFKLSELRKAKEQGMRLIARYDLGGVVTPSITHDKLNDLGIELQRKFMIEMTKPVKNEWVLVTKPHGRNIPAYKQVDYSLKLAEYVLGGEVNSEWQQEISHWYEIIDQEIWNREIKKAAGLMNDLVANRSSHGWRYLVSASEMIYDALLVSNGEPDPLYLEISTGVTGTITKETADDFEPQFLKLEYFEGTTSRQGGLEIKAFKVSGVPMDVPVSDLRYQIRV